MVTATGIFVCVTVVAIDLYGDSLASLVTAST
jgi:hypothetical protein